MISRLMTAYDSILRHKTLDSISQHITGCAYWSKSITIRGCAYDEKATTAIDGDQQGHTQLTALCNIAWYDSYST